MADNKPMSEERLAQIRALLTEIEQARERLHGVMGGTDRPRAPIVRAATELLAEVDWMRAENTALREIAEAVAEKGGVYYWAGDNICMYCEARTLAGMTGLEDDAVRHTPDCPVTKARALLAA